MKQKKIKRYRLLVSRTFPATHPRNGDPTYFVEGIKLSLAKNCLDKNTVGIIQKLHTIRGNYDRWEKIMAEVHAGNAVVELFYWDGKPYGKGVNQVVFATLDKDSGCGVQKLIFITTTTAQVEEGNTVKLVTDIELSKNDGLSLEDFALWFKGADLSKPMAIIHFTPFRY